jgi:hypothetical protein
MVIRQGVDADWMNCVSWHFPGKDFSAKDSERESEATAFQV